MNTDNVIENVRLIEEYCLTYREWPKYDEICNKLKKWTTSYKLRRWLYLSGYTTDDFKYDHLVDENGVNLKLKLDLLYQQYGMFKSEQEGKRRLNRIKQIINLIEEYCSTYGEWPICDDKENTTSDGTTSDQLYNWLYYSGYNTGDFKYSKLIDDDGISFRTKLDNLYKIYGKVRIKQNNKNINWVNLIEEYCKTYNEWPKAGCETKKTKNGITSSKLNSWIYTSGYSNDEFKYSHIIDDDGVSLKIRMDKLYQDYGCIAPKCDEYKLLMVKLIEQYCILYGSWPKYSCETKMTKDGITSRQLYEWLNANGYGTDNFRYTNILDVDGISIKDKLDRLFAIFADKNEIQQVDNNLLINLNLERSKDSKTLGVELYYLVVNLELSYANGDLEKFKYYNTILNSKLLSNSINLDVDELINSFDLSVEDRTKFYYINWKNYYSQKNRDLTILFRYLYEFEKAFIINNVKGKRRNYESVVKVKKYGSTVK